MRKLLVPLACVVVVVGVFWKEIPALRRYIKIQKM